MHSLFAAVRVQYGPFGSGVFVDQIIASQPPEAPRFSEGGDSGSLVYDSDRRCIGLLFAGREAAAANPARSEERRGGKGRVRTCRSRWWAVLKKKKKIEINEQ